MPVCPDCFRRQLVKYGKSQDKQRWRCQYCWHTTCYPRTRRPKGLPTPNNDDRSEMSDSLYLLESRTHYGDWTYDEPKGNFLSAKMLAFSIKNGFSDYWAVPDPILVRCDFFVGYWCGKDNDLICVIKSPFLLTSELDVYLSPAGVTPQAAVRLAMTKAKCVR